MSSAPEGTSVGSTSTGPTAGTSAQMASATAPDNRKPATQSGYTVTSAGIPRTKSGDDKGKVPPPVDKNQPVAFAGATSGNAHADAQWREYPNPALIRKPFSIRITNRGTTVAAAADDNQLDANGQPVKPAAPAAQVVKMSEREAATVRLAFGPRKISSAVSSSNMRRGIEWSTTPDDVDPKLLKSSLEALVHDQPTLRGMWEVVLELSGLPRLVPWNTMPTKQSAGSPKPPPPTSKQQQRQTEADSRSAWRSFFCWNDVWRSVKDHGIAPLPQAATEGVVPPKILVVPVDGIDVIRCCIRNRRLREDHFYRQSGNRWVVGPKTPASDAHSAANNGGAGGNNNATSATYDAKLLPWYLYCTTPTGLLDDICEEIQRRYSNVGKDAALVFPILVFPGHHVFGAFNDQGIGESVHSAQSNLWKECFDDSTLQFSLPSGTPANNAMPSGQTGGHHHSKGGSFAGGWGAPLSTLISRFTADSLLYVPQEDRVLTGVEHAYPTTEPQPGGAGDVWALPSYRFDHAFTDESGEEFKFLDELALRTVLKELDTRADASRVAFNKSLTADAAATNETVTTPVVPFAVFRSPYSHWAQMLAIVDTVNNLHAPATSVKPALIPDLFNWLQQISPRSNTAPHWDIASVPAGPPELLLHSASDLVVVSAASASFASSLPTTYAGSQAAAILAIRSWPLRSLFKERCNFGLRKQSPVTTSMTISSQAAQHPSVGINTTATPDSTAVKPTTAAPGKATHLSYLEQASYGDVEDAWVDLGLMSSTHPYLKDVKFDVPFVPHPYQKLNKRAQSVPSEGLCTTPTGMMTFIEEFGRVDVIMPFLPSGAEGATTTSPSAPAQVAASTTTPPTSKSAAVTSAVAEADKPSTEKAATEGEEGQKAAEPTSILDAPISSKAVPDSPPEAQSTSGAATTAPARQYLTSMRYSAPFWLLQLVSTKNLFGNGSIPKSDLEKAYEKARSDCAALGSRRVPSTVSEPTNATASENDKATSESGSATKSAPNGGGALVTTTPPQPNGIIVLDAEILSSIALAMLHKYEERVVPLLRKLLRGRSLIRHTPVITAFEAATPSRVDPPKWTLAPLSLVLRSSPSFELLGYDVTGLVGTIGEPPAGSGPYVPPFPAPHLYVHRFRRHPSHASSQPHTYTANPCVFLPPPPAGLSDVIGARLPLHLQYLMHKGIISSSTLRHFTLYSQNYSMPAVDSLFLRSLFSFVLIPLLKKSTGVLASLLGINHDGFSMKRLIQPSSSSSGPSAPAAPPAPGTTVTSTGMVFKDVEGRPFPMIASDRISTSKLRVLSWYYPRRSKIATVPNLTPSIAEEHWRKVYEAALAQEVAANTTAEGETNNEGATDATGATAQQWETLTKSIRALFPTQSKYFFDASTQMNREPAALMGEWSMAAWFSGLTALGYSDEVAGIYRKALHVYQEQQKHLSSIAATGASTTPLPPSLVEELKCIPDEKPQQLRQQLVSLEKRSIVLATLSSISRAMEMADTKTTADPAVPPATEGAAAPASDSPATPVPEGAPEHRLWSYFSSMWDDTTPGTPLPSLDARKQAVLRLACGRALILAEMTTEGFLSPGKIMTQLPDETRRVSPSGHPLPTPASIVPYESKKVLYFLSRVALFYPYRSTRFLGNLNGGERRLEPRPQLMDRQLAVMLVMARSVQVEVRRLFESCFASTSLERSWTDGARGDNTTTTATSIQQQDVTASLDPSSLPLGEDDFSALPAWLVKHAWEFYAATTTTKKQGTAVGLTDAPSVVPVAKRLSTLSDSLCDHVASRCEWLEFDKNGKALPQPPKDAPAPTAGSAPAPGALNVSSTWSAALSVPQSHVTVATALVQETTPAHVIKKRREVIRLLLRDIFAFIRCFCEGIRDAQKWHSALTFLQDQHRALGNTNSPAKSEIKENAVDAPASPAFSGRPTATSMSIGTALQELPAAEVLRRLE